MDDERRLVDEEEIDALASRLTNAVNIIEEEEPMEVGDGDDDGPFWHQLSNKAALTTLRRRREVWFFYCLIIWSFRLFLFFMSV